MLNIKDRICRDVQPLTCDLNGESTFGLYRIRKAPKLCNELGAGVSLGKIAA